MECQAISIRVFLIWPSFPIWYRIELNVYDSFPDTVTLFHAIWNGHKEHPDMALLRHVKYEMAFLPVVERFFCSAVGGKTC